jgi:hypothetical protein
MLRDLGWRVSVENEACGQARIISVDLAHSKALLFCTSQPSLADHTALATMMSSGQCVWAAIVYAEREGSEIAGWVDAFHVSELDLLVSHLAGLRRALAGPVGVGGSL